MKTGEIGDNRLFFLSSW